MLFRKFLSNETESFRGQILQIFSTEDVPNNTFFFFLLFYVMVTNIHLYQVLEMHLVESKYLTGLLMSCPGLLHVTAGLLHITV